jgi:hypothetical protein
MSAGLRIHVPKDSRCSPSVRDERGPSMAVRGTGAGQMCPPLACSSLLPSGRAGLCAHGLRPEPTEYRQIGWGMARAVALQGPAVGRDRVWPRRLRSFVAVQPRLHVSLRLAGASACVGVPRSQSHQSFWLKGTRRDQRDGIRPAWRRWYAFNRKGPSVNCGTGD